MSNWVETFWLNDQLFCATVGLKFIFHSFKSTLDGSENDMRFIYCACCICAMLDDFTPINQDLALAFIRKSLVSTFPSPYHNFMIFTVLYGTMFQMSNIVHL